MSRTVILLDSNAYFRLACSVRPLLGDEFGPDKCTLVVIPQLAQEFRRSSRLQTKFEWVLEPEYVENRARHTLTSPKKCREEIELTCSYVAGRAEELGLTVSPVDCWALASAHVLRLALATDDTGMQALAGDLQLGAKLLTTLELLKLMLDARRVSLGDVVTIVQYWQYNRDLPRNAREDYLRLFGTPMPKPD